MRGKLPCAHSSTLWRAAPSMRPAHYAREVVRAAGLVRRLEDPFNEARALCAGSSNVLAGVAGHDGPSMRPAHYAREVSQKQTGERKHGQPSMRPAHYAREVDPVALDLLLDLKPSMRPAHYAREVALDRDRVVTLAALQ